MRPLGVAVGVAGGAGGGGGGRPGGGRGGAGGAGRAAWGRLGAAAAAFGLAVGVGAHALDELRGRPQRTRIPDAILVGLAAVSIGAASAIGVVGALSFKPWIALLVPVGVFLVAAYNLELADVIVRVADGLAAIDELN